MAPPGRLMAGQLGARGRIEGASDGLARGRIAGVAKPSDSTFLHNRHVEGNCPNLLTRQVLTGTSLLRVMSR